MSKLQTNRKSSKSGFTKAGSQRYCFTFCGTRYTPKPKQHGYSETLRLQAIRMYVDGMGFRQIGRHLQVDHVTVMNWFKRYAARLPETALPKDAYTVAMDELYIHWQEKNRVYIMTFVDRETRCIIAWQVSYRRSGYEFQEMLAESIQGHYYYSDDYQGYKTVMYSLAIHYPMEDKSQTYSVEGCNADLRHYLAHLRRRSRCFSRKIEALRSAIKLFVHAYNQRQLYKHRFPAYNPPLITFATP